MSEQRTRRKSHYRPLTGPVVTSFGQTRTGPAEDAPNQDDIHTGQAEAAAAMDPPADGFGGGKDGDFDHGVHVVEIGKQVITDCETVPCTAGISGGVVCTGFIDVEKLIYPGHYKPPIFLEKKLPFQILLLTLDH